MEGEKRPRGRPKGSKNKPKSKTAAKKKTPAKCPAGKVRNPATNRCRTKCKPGQKRSEKTGQCLSGRPKGRKVTVTVPASIVHTHVKTGGRVSIHENTLKELRDKARGRITGFSKMKKAELIDALKKWSASQKRKTTMKKKE